MKTLGIIGGMGPMATAYLLELIIQMTAAKTDQEHLGAVVLNNPQVPARTAYILDREKPSPLPVLEGMAHALENLGCGVLCAPCVTSHYFYQELAGCVKVPTRFLPAERFTPVLPPTEESTMASSDVGACTTVMPRMNVDAVNPARSPTPPPPSATTAQSRPSFKPAIASQISLATSTDFVFSPAGTTISLTR